MLKCKYCGKAFKGRGGAGKHEKTCASHPQFAVVPKVPIPKAQADEAIWKCRYQVYDLRTRGISPTAIASALGIKIGTVFDDWKELTENVIEHLRNTPKLNLVVNELMKAEKMEDDIRTEYFGRPSTQPMAKSALFGKWVDIWERKIEKMQAFGLLPRQPDQLEVVLKGQAVTALTMEQLLERQHAITRRIADIKERRQVREQPNAGAQTPGK